MTDRDIKRWRAYARETAKSFKIPIDDADEVEQDCLLDLLKCWSKPTGDRDDYFGTVIKNRCRMWMRKARTQPERRRVSPLNTQYIHHPHTPSEDRIIDDTFYDSMMADLSAFDQSIMAESRQGRSESEIAKALSLTHNTVKVAIKRIRRQLQRQHSPDDQDLSCVTPEDVNERQPIRDNGSTHL